MQLPRYTPKTTDMATQYRSHVFKRDDEWETVDTYWSSPLSFWSQKSMRVEPPVAIRVKVLGSVLQDSEEGWINYGGLSAVLVQIVQARGHAGQRVRVEINDEPIVVREV